MTDADVPTFYILLMSNCIIVIPDFNKQKEHF